jgi:hypothetical protein
VIVSRQPTELLSKLSLAKPFLCLGLFCPLRDQEGD